MRENIKKLFGKNKIARKVRQAAKWLDGKFYGCAQPPLAICVLKGSVFFFCDLVRAMRVPVQIDFISVSSYGDGKQSSGKPEITRLPSAEISGRDVIIVEDVVDSGLTLAATKSYFEEAGAKSVVCVTLLDKPSRREAPVSADFYCFTVGDEFVVGYGLDFAQKYRDLPYVGALEN